MNIEGLARKISKKAKHRYALHACIVTKGGAVMAIGYNINYTHAEADALGKIWPSERIHCVLYSFRVTRAGKLSMAKPCDKCEELIKDSGIKIVWYTTGDSQLTKMKL